MSPDADFNLMSIPAYLDGRVYCEGIFYDDITDIPEDLPGVVDCLDKLQNMTFSKGHPVNIKNPVFYAKLCHAFFCHLDNVDNSFIYASGEDPEGRPYDMKLNLTYRTSARYKKRNVARAYQLIDSINNLNVPDIQKSITALERKPSLSPDDLLALEDLHTRLALAKCKDVTLVTFTARQRDQSGRAYDFIKLNKRLADGKKRIHDNIRKHHHHVPYMVVTEAHKTGYLHYHVLYGCHIPADERERLKRLWSDVYKIGSYENGLQFSFYKDSPKEKPKKEGQRQYKNNFEGAARYLIKYVCKGINPALAQLEQKKDSLKQQYHNVDKGKHANRSADAVFKIKNELLDKIEGVRNEIKESVEYPFYQALADACIWFVSRKKNGLQGIRSYFISPVWNSLIKHKFNHSSKVVFDYVVLNYCGCNITILDDRGGPDPDDIYKDLWKKSKSRLMDILNKQISEV